MYLEKTPMYSVHMHITLNLNTSESEVREAIATLERLLPNPTPKQLADLDTILGAVADPGKYGHGRLGYLDSVAKAGDKGASVDKLLNEHFAGNHQAFGGTHASIEKSWRALGGEAFAPKLIDDTPDGTRQVMIPEARDR